MIFWFSTKSIIIIIWKKLCIPEITQFNFFCQDLGHAHRSRDSNALDSNRTHRDRHNTMKSGGIGKSKNWQGSGRVKESKIKVPYSKMHDTPYQSVPEQIRRTISHRYQNNMQYRGCTEYRYAEQPSISYIPIPNENGTNTGSSIEKASLDRLIHKK